MIDKEIYENQRMTNIEYVFKNNENNYTIWYSNDYALTFMAITLDTSQDDISLLNDDADISLLNTDSDPNIREKYW